MKGIKKVIITIICIAAFYAILPASVNAAEAAWSDAVTINDPSALTSSQPFFVAGDNVLYSAWSEKSGTNNIIRVKKYDGSTWSYIDNGGINYNRSMSAYNPYLIIIDNTLYAAWEEENIVGQLSTIIRVKKYDGSSWSSVDGDAGISYDFYQDSENVFLQVHNGSLYAAWSETFNGAIYQLHVKKYLGGNSWSSEDYGSVNGLNYDNDYSALNPSLASYNNKLYLIWTEPDIGNVYQINMKCFDGSSWSLVGYGMNADPGNYAQSPKLFVLNNSLFAAWYEMGATDLIRLKKYNGVSWELVDGGQLNKSTSLYVFNLEGLVYNNTLYLSWVEMLSDSISQLTMVLKYDGNTVTYLEGDNLNTGINLANSDSNSAPAMAVFNKSLYVAWVENNSIYQRSFILPHSKISSPVNLTEETLDLASLSLALYGTSFNSNTLDKNHFSLVNAPQGLSIEKVTYNNSSQCTVDLAFDGTDFDTDISNLSVIVDGFEVIDGMSLTDTNTMPITATKDTESISIIDDGAIWEGEENGEIITVTLHGGTFAKTIHAADWTVSNLPAGVTKGSVVRTDAHTVSIILSGNSTTDYDTDITNISVTCPDSDYVDSTGGGSLTADKGVVLKSKNIHLNVMAGAGGTFKINDGVELPIYNDEFTRGTLIKLTAVPVGTFSFAYWLDVASSSIVSTNPVYEFTVGTGVYLQAVFQTNQADLFNVVFKDPSGRILSNQLVSNGSAAAEPKNTFIMGYEFLGWDKDFSNVTGNMEVMAKYRRLPDTYHLTVTNGTITTGGSTGDYKYDTLVTVIADMAPTDKKFAYWTMDGVIVSRSMSYSFYTIMGSMNLTAEYVDLSTPIPNDPLIALLPLVAIDADHNSMLFIANRDLVPSGSTLIESGFLLYKASDSWSGELTVDTLNIITAKVKNTSTNQFYIRKNNIVAGETWYVRTYMIYRDTAGNVQIAYSTNTVNGKIS